MILVNHTFQGKVFFLFFFFIGLLSKVCFDIKNNKHIPEEFRPLGLRPSRLICAPLLLLYNSTALFFFFCIKPIYLDINGLIFISLIVLLFFFFFNYYYSFKAEVTVDVLWNVMSDCNSCVKPCMLVMCGVSFYFDFPLSLFLCELVYNDCITPRLHCSDPF